MCLFLQSYECVCVCVCGVTLTDTFFFFSASEPLLSPWWKICKTKLLISTCATVYACLCDGAGRFPVSEGQNNYLGSCGTKLHLSTSTSFAMALKSTQHAFIVFVLVKKVSCLRRFVFCSSAAMVVSCCSCCPGNLHWSLVGVFQWFGS